MEPVGSGMDSLAGACALYSTLFVAPFAGQTRSAVIEEHNHKGTEPSIQSTLHVIALGRHTPKCKLITYMPVGQVVAPGPQTIHHP